MARLRYVKGNYTKIIGGDYDVWATGDINLYSAKKLYIEAEEGIVLGTEWTEPPKLEPQVVESKYTLESTYAHEQLKLLATELDELPFILFAMAIFGQEIEITAYSKLYKALSDESLQPPEIAVSFIPTPKGKAAFKKSEQIIVIWEHFIDLAVKDNEKSIELFMALQEEYGHYIDHKLRHEYSSNSNPDKDHIDEGAKYAYNLSFYMVDEEPILKYAEVETPHYKGDLQIDFTNVQKALQEYTPKEQMYDANWEDDFEGFGAGFEPGMHGGIERAALKKIINSTTKVEEFTNKEILQIYYGNWLRDYSQVIVGMTIRLDKEINKAMKTSKVTHLRELAESNAIKIEHEDWVELIELLAAKEFVYDRLQESKPKDMPLHYADYLKAFRKQFGTLNKDILGVYRPEEHIDNPRQLADESMLPVSFQYEYKKGQKRATTLFAGEYITSCSISQKTNAKTYIHTTVTPSRPSAEQYVREQLGLAIAHGRNKNGFRHFGAALHVLEDFFAHTNFIELSLIKAGFKKVYPWVEGMQGNKYETIPLVTGKFLTDDTLASILPKVGEKMFPIGFQEYKQRYPGDRTFSEAMVLKFLKSQIHGQGKDANGAESKTYQGIEVATILKNYERFLKIVDGKAELMQNLGAAGRFLDKGLQRMMELFGTYANFAFNIMMEGADDAIKESQTHETNKHYGTDPTHTQLAKDATDHPLNPLASELAKTMIIDVTKRLLEVWQNKTGEQALLDYVINTYFQHPKFTDWADEKVKDWADGKQNTIRRLSYPTLYEHSHSVTKRVLNNKKVKEILNYYNK